MHSIPAVYMRGGTSKGIFLHTGDVPGRGPELDQLLLGIMGSPDPLQIDGMGGTFSSTSKVVIVEPAVDGVVTYWFAQIGVDRATVDWSGNCGNLTSAVAPFAIDEGLVTPTGDPARVQLLNGNTGVTVESEVRVENGRAATTGALAIAGVPGTGSPVLTRYLDPAGGVLGSLFPTGSARDELRVDDRVRAVSIVDVSHPYVFVSASSVGLGGDLRTPAELNADSDLLRRVEAIRAECSVIVGAAGSAGRASREAPIVPRIVLVEPADDAESDFRATAFSMGLVHRALPMTAALCAAAAAVLPGTVVHALTDVVGDVVRIRHPRGVAEVTVERGDRSNPIRSVGITRTARRLMEGRVFPREY